MASPCSPGSSWPRAAVRALVGDPGSAYLPSGLKRLAAYQVRTSRELKKQWDEGVAVYTL